jgi:transcriptional antiterminator RfaH
MTDEPSIPPIEMTGPAWYCVRTQTKHEHIAAGHLATVEGVREVYCPRIKFRRATRRGPVWFLEALFPGYLFAKFDLMEAFKAVTYTPGVRGIVHFGRRHAVVPEAVIDGLRRQVRDDEIKVFDEPLKAGDQTEVLAGPFAGLQAVVSRVLPARERIRILLTFLGRATEVEVARDLLRPPPGHPLRAGDAGPSRRES